MFLKAHYKPQHIREINSIIMFANTYVGANLEISSTSITLRPCHCDSITSRRLSPHQVKGCLSMPECAEVTCFLLSLFALVFKKQI